MALSPNINSREFAKFREGDRVAVTLENGILAGLQYDDIQATYPNATTENYSYYLAGQIVATIEVTYSNSNKKDLLRARRI